MPNLIMIDRYGDVSLRHLAQRRPYTQCHQSTLLNVNVTNLTRVIKFGWKAGSWTAWPLVQVSNLPSFFCRWWQHEN